MFEHLKTDFENEISFGARFHQIGIPPITDAPIFAQLLGEFKKSISTNRIGTLRTRF